MAQDEQRKPSLNDDPDTIGARISEKAPKDPSQDGRRNNPGRPKGLPRNSEYKNHKRD